jgi:hypothetical protein
LLLLVVAAEATTKCPFALPWPWPFLMVLSYGVATQLLLLLLLHCAGSSGVCLMRLVATT